MKQKMDDLITLLKNDKKAKVVAIVIVCMLLYLVFADGNSGRRAVRKTAVAQNNAKQDISKLSSKEAYEDIITAFQADISQIKDQQTGLVEDITSQKKNLKDYEERTTEIFKKVLERLSEAETAQARIGEMDLGDAGDSQDMNPNALNSELPDEQLTAFGLDSPEVAPPPPPGPKRIAVIGPGDSVRVKLLAGVDAPTDGTPYPVVFQIVGDVDGPNGSSLPIGEARLVAAAQGSLTDSRALFRLTQLNVQLPSGERKFYSIDGWIVGEDGVRGMSGILIDPIGQALGGALVTGGLEGFGRAVSRTQSSVFTSPLGTTTEVVNGNQFDYAAGEAISDAAQTWGGIIKERINRLVPHVQVLSGRDATAIFARSVKIPGLMEEYDDDDVTFTSLD